MILPVLALPWLTWNLVAAGYLKLVLTDAAIEGARFAALADQSPEAAKARALRMVSQATGGLASANASFRRQIDASGVVNVELQLVTVEPFQIVARAKAIAER